MKLIIPFLLCCCYSFSALAQLDTFVVYPGDTNNDSIVTVRDLLPIGVAYFQETLPRPTGRPNSPKGLNLPLCRLQGSTWRILMRMATAL